MVVLVNNDFREHLLLIIVVKSNYKQTTKNMRDTDAEDEERLINFVNMTF